LVDHKCTNIIVDTVYFSTLSAEYEMQEWN